MLNIQYQSKFKKDLRLLAKRGYDMKKINNVITMLAEEKPLPARYQDHALRGSWVGYRECHILPDWLLIYSVNNNILLLTIVRSGTHADLFGL